MLSASFFAYIVSIQTWPAAYAHIRDHQQKGEVVTGLLYKSGPGRLWARERAFR